MRDSQASRSTHCLVSGDTSSCTFLQVMQDRILPPQLGSAQLQSHSPRFPFWTACGQFLW